MLVRLIIWSIASYGLLEGEYLLWLLVKKVKPFSKRSVDFAFGAFSPEFANSHARYRFEQNKTDVHHDGPRGKQVTAVGSTGGA